MKVAYTTANTQTTATEHQQGRLQMCDKIKQKSLANAKGKVQQRCMFEGQLRTKSNSPIPANDIRYDAFTYARWCHCLAWRLPFDWPNASIFKGYPSLMPPYREFIERRGEKFKLVKTTFNAGSFVCRLS